MLEWMSWTLPTASFFSGIAVLLLSMTILQILRPTKERKGVLPIVTTRGDRLFIGLLTSGYIHLLWIAFAASSLWYASAISLIFLVWVMIWG